MSSDDKMYKMWRKFKKNVLMPMLCMRDEGETADGGVSHSQVCSWRE